MGINPGASRSCGRAGKWGTMCGEHVYTPDQRSFARIEFFWLSPPLRIDTLRSYLPGELAGPNSGDLWPRQVIAE